MEWETIRSITIDWIELQTELSKKANNPVAEDAYKKSLEDAINAGVTVTVTDTLGRAACSFRPLRQRLRIGINREPV